MKSMKVIFLLFVSNLIFPMEAERKSLASFFCVEQCVQHQDISQHISRHCLSDQKWWYVDKEIQFYGFKHHNSYHPILGRYPNYLRCVCFDSAGTNIIAFPNEGWGDLACIWNRDGKELERLDQDALYTFCDSNDQWASELYNSGNSPWKHEYAKDMQKLLDEQFDLASMICWNDGQAFVASQFKAYGCCRVHAWNQKENKILFTIHHQNLINSVAFNPQGIEMITASSDKSMRLWNKKTGQQLLRINYDTRLTSASFNGLGTEMVVATDDGNIQIFAKYCIDNLQHILLKKLLHLWLQLQMPNKEIDSPEKLLDIVGCMLHCNYDEIKEAWQSFPEHMQNAIWLSMHKKIQRYGIIKEEESV